MTIARTAIAISIGTVANNATTTSSEQDPQGDDASEGSAILFETYTSTAAAGTIDTSIAFAPTTTTESTTRIPLVDSIIPINGTETNFPLGAGQGMDFARFWKAIVKNNAVTASITSVAVNVNFSKRS